MTKMASYLELGKSYVFFLESGLERTMTLPLLNVFLNKASYAASFS